MNVPQLRFDGFDEQWKEIKLGELLDFKNGLNYLKSDRGETVYTVGVKNFNQKKLKSTLELEAINLSSIPNKEFLLQKDDLLFVRSNGNKELVGRMMWIETELINTYYSGFVIRGRIKERTVLEPLFLLFLESKIKDAMKTLTGGTNISNLSQSILNSLVLNVPSIEEQKKIASFISLLEQKIEKQQEKIGKLEQFKKGMMQKIFSQELRFKDDDGGKFDEWKEATLADLGATYTGLSGKTKEDFGHGEASFITYVNVFNNLKASIDGLQAVDLSDGKNQNPVCQGDILFTTSSETPHEVGMASYWAYDQKDVYLNSFCFGFRLTSDVVNGEFLAYLLRSPIYRAIITLLAQGSTRYNISKAGLMKMKVLVPAIKEQRKIVRVLSQIDTKLDKEKEKLMVLEEQKKGLMQRMFV